MFKVVNIILIALIIKEGNIWGLFEEIAELSLRLYQSMYSYQIY